MPGYIVSVKQWFDDQIEAQFYEVDAMEETLLSDQSLWAFIIGKYSLIRDTRGKARILLNSHVHLTTVNFLFV